MHGPSVGLGLRVAEEVKQALFAAADADGRTASNLGERILREWLEKNGWLKAKRKG